MFCKNCGKEIDNDSKFCKYCGEKFVKENLVVVENKVTHINKEVSIDNIFTAQEFFNLLISEGIMPSTQIVLESCKIYKDGHFVANYFTERLYLGELEKGNILSLVYDTELIRRPSRRDFYDGRDMVCLYGCPNSRKNKN